jgi:hypothetical protein
MLTERNELDIFNYGEGVLIISFFSLGCYRTGERNKHANLANKRKRKRKTID